MKSIDSSWNRLARLAGGTPADDPPLPPGFGMRVAAVWKEASPEKFFAVLEGMTWRGLAVALVVFGGCAALGYDSFVSALSGEAAQAGDWLNEWLGL